jgi:beta-glucosidase-like glycosyl hydrolase
VITTSWPPMHNIKYNLLVLCMTIAAVWAQANSEYLILNSCSGSNTQQWDLSYLSIDQTIRLKTNNNFCLDISGYGTTDGSYVWLYSCHTSDKDPTHQNQEFVYDPVAKTFTNPESNKVLDASNYGTTPGTRIWIWDKTGATNQQWVYNTTDNSIRGVQSGLCLDVMAPPPRPCDAAANKALPFCDMKLSFVARAQDLVSRIPETDKWGLFGNGASGVYSLSIAPYQWWSEALHGVAGSPGVTFTAPTPVATSFPQVCVTGSSFDTELWAAIGTAIGTEGRAFANVGNAGLTFWTPNLNIFRDPRWGRGQETPGEDPYLTAQYVRHYVAALQGGNNASAYLQVSSCCKHYAAYSLEHWEGYDRCSFNAIVTEQDLQDTYLPAFESCISPSSAGGSGIMCSYNAVNGIPSCANDMLLTGYARQKWGFNGYITGDCGAVQCVQDNHHYTSNSNDTCKAVLTAGLDIDCGNFLPSYLAQAVAGGAVSMDLVNQHLVNLFVVQMRLGMFDPLDIQPYAKYNASNVNTEAHQQLALLAALRGIVLLKNNAATLPLAKKGTVAVIGPNAQATTTLQGNYYGNPPFLISPEQGIAQYVATRFSLGCNMSSNDTSGFADACSAASSADATVIIAGLDQTQEREGYDRSTITWPGVQEEMILKVASCSKGPVVLVVFGGGPIDMTQEKNSDSVGAILWAGYPGQSGGTALAQIIFGDVSPSGRMTHTTYPANYVNQVSNIDMGMRPNSTTGNPGRTYRFYTGEAVYPFGTGLSYTSFTFTFSNTSDQVTTFDAQKINAIVSDPFYSRVTAEPISVTQAVVTNTGQVTSDVSVLLFTQGPTPGQNGNPIKELSGFARVNGLAPGKSQTVQFGISAHDLCHVDEHGNTRAAVGTWKLMIEDSVLEVHVI